MLKAEGSNAMPSIPGSAEVSPEESGTMKLPLYVDTKLANKETVVGSGPQSDSLFFSRKPVKSPMANVMNRIMPGRQRSTSGSPAGDKVKFDIQIYS